MPAGRLWGELLRPWPFADYLNPMSMSTRSSRSDSPGLDAFALSKLLWSDDSEDEVEEHILTNETSFDIGSHTRKETEHDEDGTDNPDEDEVDGLIDSFDVGPPERSLGRVSSWRAGVIRPTSFGFINQAQALSPLPTLRKRKRSSIDVKEQPSPKFARLIVDQPICPACNSTFVSRQNLQRHGLRAQASEACREATSYAFE